MTLDYIHAAGIIHGDVRQENLMYDSFFKRFVFIDFGHVKGLDERERCGMVVLDRARLRWILPGLRTVRKEAYAWLQNNVEWWKIIVVPGSERC